MTGDRYLLAIDMGTTTARVLLFDLQGRPLVEAYREPPVYHPQPNHAEIDVEERWQCTASLIREVLARPGVESSSVAAVGLSSLLHALTPIDEAGRVLARAMLWMDQRCQPQVEWMVREHRATLETVMGWAGVSTTLSAPKLRWLAEHRPDIVQRARWFLATKDFLRLRLTGEVATDPTDAGGAYLLDPRTEDWAWPIVEMVGISPAQLPSHPVLGTSGRLYHGRGGAADRPARGHAGGHRQRRYDLHAHRGQRRAKRARLPLPGHGRLGGRAPRSHRAPLGRRRPPARRSSGWWACCQQAQRMPPPPPMSPCCRKPSALRRARAGLSSCPT